MIWPDWKGSSDFHEIFQMNALCANEKGPIIPISSRRQATPIVCWVSAAKPWQRIHNQVGLGILGGKGFSTVVRSTVGWKFYSVPFEGPLQGSASKPLCMGWSHCFVHSKCGKQSDVTCHCVGRGVRAGWPLILQNHLFCQSGQQIPSPPNPLDEHMCLKPVAKNR